MNSLCTNAVRASVLISILGLAACGGSSSSGYGDSTSPSPTPEASSSPEASPSPSPEASPSPSPEVSPSPSPSPSPAAVTLADVQSSVFNQSCGFSGCHGGASPSAGLALDSESNSFNALVNVSSGVDSLLFVEPGNPDDSYLVRKLEGATGIVGLQMPRGGSPLSNELITLVRDWISGGALQSSAVSSSTRVLKTTVQDDIESLTYRMQLSSVIDPNSVSGGAVQLYLIKNGHRYLAEADTLTIGVSGAQLIVTYTDTDASFDSIELELNSPGLASMLDIYGVAVEGGTFSYPSFQM